MTDNGRTPQGSWVTAVEAALDWPTPSPEEALSEPITPFSEVSDNGLEPAPYTDYEPWGQMDGETARSFQLFDFYRSLGITRTRADVAKHFKISRTRVDKIAREYLWDDRIRAWDEYRERQYTASIIEGTKEMALEHAQTARNGIMALSRAFDAINHRFEDDPEEFQAELRDMKPTQLFGLAQKAAQVIPNLMSAERTSRGLPSEITASVVREEKSITLQSSDELAEILVGVAGALGFSIDEGAGVIDVRSAVDVAEEEADPED